MEFRATMVKMMSRLEKSINKNVTENIESLRVEMRVNPTEIKNSMKQMLSKLEALTARSPRQRNALANWRMGY